MKKMIVLAIVLLALFGVTFAIAQNDGADAHSDAAQEEAIFAEEAMEENELQEDVQIYEMTGEILEVNEEEGWILIDNAQLGHVQVLFSDDTLIEGVEALQAGQYASVMHDGKMTRSLPPQITAMRIGVYAVEGVVTEVTDEYIVIERDDTGEEVIITLPTADAVSGATGEADEEVAEEATETEAEVEAETEEDVTGADAAVTEEEDAEEIVILVGDHVIAYTTGVSTMSLPPQMNAIAIVHAQEATPAEAETVG